LHAEGGGGELGIQVGDELGDPGLPAPRRRGARRPEDPREVALVRGAVAGAGGLVMITWGDKDFDVDEWHGTNAFIREGDRVFRTYFINNRGDEQMGNTWNYLDITALGRQETWEDSPEGYPQTPPYQWWNYHDVHDAAK
jgi:predicted dithiol-disulfide oxidoreductase (DUF899 family)